MAACAACRLFNILQLKAREQKSRCSENRNPRSWDCLLACPSMEIAQQGRAHLCFVLMQISIHTLSGHLVYKVWGRKETCPFLKPPLPASIKRVAGVPARGLLKQLDRPLAIVALGDKNQAKSKDPSRVSIPNRQALISQRHLEADSQKVPHSPYVKIWVFSKLPS